MFTGSGRRAAISGHGIGSPPLSNPVPPNTADSPAMHASQKTWKVSDFIVEVPVNPRIAADRKAGGRHRLLVALRRKPAAESALFFATRTARVERATGAAWVRTRARNGSFRAEA